MGNLKTLDLSFSKLQGKIPDSFVHLSQLQYIYLTGNLLSGPVPVLDKPQNLNLFGDPLMANDSGSVTCMIGTCSKTWYFININCGGNQETIGDTVYDGDLNTANQGFAKSATNWAISSTDGQYTVRLHFVEIMFTDDQTFRSAGRLVFDVYIQEQQMLKDFNIVNEAGEVGKLIIKFFTVHVTSGSLKIRFHWHGKGTTAIPQKSVYGPLISAISIISDFKPPRSIPGAVVAAIVAASVSIVILILGLFWWRGALGKRSSFAIELKSSRSANRSIYLGLNQSSNK